MRSVSCIRSKASALQHLALTLSVNQPRHKWRDQRTSRTILLLLLCLLWRDTSLSDGTAQPADGKKGGCSHEGCSWAKCIVQEAPNQASQPKSHSHVEPLHNTAGSSPCLKAARESLSSLWVMQAGLLLRQVRAWASLQAVPRFRRHAAGGRCRHTIFWVSPSHRWVCNIMVLYSCQELLSPSATGDAGSWHMSYAQCLAGTSR